MEAGAGVMESGGVGVGVGHKNKIGYVKKGIIKKRKWMRRIIKQAAAVPIMPMSLQLQQLFDSCLDIFKGPPPPFLLPTMSTNFAPFLVPSSFLFFFTY